MSCTNSHLCKSSQRRGPTFIHPSLFYQVFKSSIVNLALQTCLHTQWYVLLYCCCMLPPLVSSHHQLLIQCIFHSNIYSNVFYSLISFKIKNMSDGSCNHLSRIKVLLTQQLELPHSTPKSLWIMVPKGSLDMLGLQ